MFLGSKCYRFVLLDYKTKFNVNYLLLKLAGSNPLKFKNCLSAAHFHPGIGPAGRTLLTVIIVNRKLTLLK